MQILYCVCSASLDFAGFLSSGTKSFFAQDNVIWEPVIPRAELPPTNFFYQALKDWNVLLIDSFKKLYQRTHV
jgi:hypothetical protein